MKKNLVIIVLALTGIMMGVAAYIQKLRGDAHVKLAERYHAVTMQCERMAEQARMEADQQRMLAIMNEQKALEYAQKLEGQLKNKKLK